MILISMFLKPSGPILTALISILGMIGVYFYNELLTSCEVEDKKKEILGMAGGLASVFLISIVIYNRMVVQAKEILNVSV